jgi:hypothetical protein
MIHQVELNTRRNEIRILLNPAKTEEIHVVL